MSTQAVTQSERAREATAMNTAPSTATSPRELSPSVINPAKSTRYDSPNSSSSTEDDGWNWDRIFVVGGVAAIGMLILLEIVLVMTID